MKIDAEQLRKLDALVGDDKPAFHVARTTGIDLETVQQLMSAEWTTAPAGASAPRGSNRRRGRHRRRRPPR